MTRPHLTAKRKKTSTAQRTMRPAVAARPGVLTVDPKTEKEVTDLFLNLLRRLGITFLIMTVVGMVTTGIARMDRSTTAPVIFLSILFGIGIAYIRGVKLVFEAAKKLGIERFEQRKFADAAHVLEHFHRVGNHGQDSKGEAHYYLMLAYLALNQPQKATEVVDWMSKHRKNSEWSARALQEHATYLKKHSTGDGAAKQGMEEATAIQ